MVAAGECRWPSRRPGRIDPDAVKLCGIYGLNRPGDLCPHRLMPISYSSITAVRWGERRRRRPATDRHRRPRWLGHRTIPRHRRLQCRHSKPGRGLRVGILREGSGIPKRSGGGRQVRATIEPLAKIGVEAEEISVPCISTDRILSGISWKGRTEMMLRVWSATTSTLLSALDQEAFARGLGTPGSTTSRQPSSWC